MSVNGRRAFWIKKGLGPMISNVQATYQFLDAVLEHRPNNSTKIELYFQVNNTSYIDPAPGTSTQFRDDLHRFLRIAQKPPYRMEVHAFGGRPNWIDTDVAGNFTHLEDFIDAVHNFNASTNKPFERFKALHIDVEPHGCFNGACAIDFIEGNNETLWSKFLNMFQTALDMSGTLDVYADLPPWYYNSQAKNGVTQVDVEKVSIAPTANPMGIPVGHALGLLEGPGQKKLEIVLMSYRNSVDPTVSTDGSLNRGIVGFSEQAIEYFKNTHTKWWFAVETQALGGDVVTPKVTYGAENHTLEDLTADINTLYDRYRQGGTEMQGAGPGGLIGTAIHYWASFIGLPLAVPEPTEPSVPTFGEV